MSYLYGDSTPSRLESNFIQFLSDALDVSVKLLLSGERMKECSERTAELQAKAEREIGRLEALGQSVGRAIETTREGTGDETSPTATCAAAITAHVAELVTKQIAEVRAGLATSVAAVEAEDALERSGCLKSLETLLATHDLPEATTTFHLVHAAGRYLCKRAASTPYGLEWVLDIDVASPHPFSQIARIDKFVPQLEVTAPEMGGWLRKEVRNRTQRLEKLQLVEMTFTPEGGFLKLRASLDEGASGFNVAFAGDGVGVRLHRVDDGTVEEGEGTEPSEADAAKLIALQAKLRALALSIPSGHGRLEDAKLDDHPVEDLGEPAVVVDRLVTAMAPIVAEIAQHSLSPSELVLKRLLGDNRREEIFVSKATLNDKLGELPEPLRGSFKPLGLNGIRSESGRSSSHSSSVSVRIASALETAETTAEAP